MNPKLILSLLKESYAEFSKDNAMRLAAALAYYTIFSIAPLLVITIAIAHTVFRMHGVTAQIIEQVKAMVGESGGAAIQSMLQSANQKKDGVAMLIGGITLLFGAAGAFGQLQDALNTVWKAKPPEHGGFWGLIKNRFLSFTMVLGTGFLMLVSLVISAALNVISKWFSGFMPGTAWIAAVLNFALSLAVISLLFAMIFKYLPDVPIAWSDVWHGAIATGLLFTVGKSLLGLYLGRSAVASSYGAAGSLVVVLLWIYYSSMILLFGAEFTEVYARRVGGKKTAPQPMPNAGNLAVENKERSQAFLQSSRGSAKL